MNLSVKWRKLFLALFVLSALGSFTKATSAQAETLGSVSYTAPVGWNKTAQANVVAYSKVDPATGKFCIITLYGPTPGTGKPETDFKREWANLVLKNMNADADPKTESQMENGWTATGGGSATDVSGAPAFALLTVLSGGGRTVSILGVFNDSAFTASLAAFSDSIELGKAAADGPAPPVQNGDPRGLRQLTIADIAGEWGETAGDNTRYVDRATGVYAGADSVHFTSKMTFTANGGYADDFFGLQNGRKIQGNTTGTVSIDGRVLTIKRKGLAKYVIRGWEELANVTLLHVCGPWYDDQPIPEHVFTIPDSSVNLDKTWIRKK
ncbi:MAG: hypothetical protein ABIR33_14695 [Pyrinomonadaceae bacterium]